MAPSPGPTTPRRTICKPRVSELAVGSRGRQCLGAQPAAPRRRPRGCPLLAGRATATTGQAASPEIPRATTIFMINSRFLDRARWHALSPSEARGAQKALPSPGSQGGCDMQQASIMCLSTRRARLPSSGSVIMQPGVGRDGGAYGKQRTQALGQAPMVSPTLLSTWDGTTTTGPPKEGRLSHRRRLVRSPGDASEMPHAQSGEGDAVFPRRRGPKTSSGGDGSSSA